MKEYYFSLPLILVFVFFACSDQEGDQKKSESPKTIQQPDTSQVQTEPDSLIEVEKEVTQEPFIIAKTDEGQYSVQVSSWRKRTNAEREAQRFINLGYDAYVQEAYLADRDQTWYRVRIGRFRTMAEGRQVAAQLAELLESQARMDENRAEK
jgi:cell division protein FtsN